MLHLDFIPPSSEDLFKLGKKIVEKEDINITIPALKKFINDSEYDLRGFLTTLSIFVDKNKKIDTENLKDVQKSTQKDIYLSVQNTITEFVDPKCKKLGDFKDRCRFVSMNTSSIISENYLDIINKKTSLEDLSKMADYICLGDVYKIICFLINLGNFLNIVVYLVQNS